MDLHPIQAKPSDAERDAIDAVLGPTLGAGTGEGPFGLREAEARRHLLLPALHAAQARVGWVSPGALGHICERLHIPPAEGFGVASFYALFALREQPAAVVHVCDDIACKARGADALCDELDETANLAWKRSPCLGLCEQAPAAMLVSAGESPFERAWGHATAESVTRALADKHVPIPARTVLPQAGSPHLRLLARVGVVDPSSLDDYRAHGGYRALRRALDLGATGTIREITESKLVGRGGAAFPTGRKWDAVARQPVRERTIVCNADESEPGTFKDRVIMEDDPFSIIEGMTVAGFACGAEKGYLYVRGEYPLATERLAHAITSARARGLLGHDIMGRGVRFDIEIRRGAGAYICGEETALFNSIEGFRGEPKSKPPFPVEVGLFGKPTCVNNVETLISALDVINTGSAGYAALGTAGSAGSKLFCVSGHVERPGLYEVPFGTPLAALLDLAGGVRGGRKLQTILLGGAAGAFVKPSDLATPLTFEDARRIGATLGSGVVLVLDDSVEILPILQRIAAFFRDESCGQCVPCRVGTVRQEELITRIARKKPLGSASDERQLLRELGQAMRDASICGLGQTASSAIESAVDKLDVIREMP